MQIVSYGDNLHKMSNLIFWENQEIYFEMFSKAIFSKHIMY